MTERKRRAIKISRDTLLFIVGLLGIAHETLLTNLERPGLLILFSGMVGLPFVARADEKRRSSGDVDGKP